MDMKLSDLEPGQKAIIKRFNSNDIFLKLMEMGCLPGEKVVFEQTAPLGDPISINISGYTLSLRRSEADEIIVELIDYQ